MARLGLRLTPRGNLVLEPSDEAVDLEENAAARLTAAFARGSGAGLLQLGAGEVGHPLPAVFSWWRGFASRHVEALCRQVPEAAPGDHGGSHGAAGLPPVAPPGAAELGTLLLTAPLMPGGEYLTDETLLALWHDLGAALADGWAAAGHDLQGFLKHLSPAWNLVGRVHFNLAENRRDPDFPFAFLATYTTRLTGQGRAQHVKLGEALREYAGAANRGALLSLLLPVQRAAERCAWLKAMVDAGEIFHPLRWTPADAAQLLASAAELDAAGVILRMPPAWKAGRPARPQASATVGGRPPSGLGLDGLLDFRMEVTLEGEPLTETEIAALLAATDGLVLLRGRWVEVDRSRLERAVRELREAEALAAREGLSFAEAMRLLAGATIAGTDPDMAARTDGWARITAGPWLAEALRSLRAPDGAGADPGRSLQGTLRPYQKAGVQWLRLLSGLRLGACLADDMGLGKTIQLLSLLLILKEQNPDPRPNLLVAPASLLANWMAEIARFAPGLAARVLHPSAMPSGELRRLAPQEFAGLDLAITSYGTVSRLPALTAADWRLVVLDEAQAIKNPGTRQAKAAKGLRAQSRIALTGTPVENRLGDLWSIFDFINPGLLGTTRQFGSYTKSLADGAPNPYGPLRELVRPYILRRMKTDKAVIAHLPDKTEVAAYCTLSRRQAALYAETVSDLAEALADAEGIRRKGIVLAALMRLKQICNHPAQWLNEGHWAEDESGKLARLREIAATVAARQEKILVFTQFREATAPLAAFLGEVFGRPGLVLHGGTPVRERRSLVERFQQDEALPFFVLSLKAGGTGLTLTAAAHVVHFDRWWNPAVEEQATDRAFRIGQKRNVLVHKFVCRGTMEEKIDALITAKRSLAAELLGGGAEIDLTAMSDAELLDMVALDLQALTGD
ncbi:MAG TPA: DEAD/DEAH box helicase [Falsiroseomonas sp.]|jgi:non-specific serine/threonine protein kinase|nr:DEAD/DEAH box helicase [Falsiroseomonas sp.]